MLPPGSPAPDPVLAIRPREWVSIHQLRDGKPAVLLFFPLAFSSTCTEEICSVADNFAPYDELGVSVFGISIDSPYVNNAFARETGATFPILSDFNKEATRAYDVYRDDLGGLKGVSERAVFIIDREGTIAWTWMGEHPGVLPPFQEIEREARRLSDS